MDNRYCDHDRAVFHAHFSEETETLDADFGEKVYIYKGDIEEYDGEYSIIPDVVDQSLPTAQKALTQNVRVLAVPFSTVSNNGGGLTANIGG